MRPLNVSQQLARVSRRPGAPGSQRGRVDDCAQLRTPIRQDGPMGRVQAIGDLSIQRRLRVAYISHTAAPSGAELSLLEMLGDLDVDRQVLLGADGPLRDRFADVATLTVLPLPRQADEL